MKNIIASSLIIAPMLLSSDVLPSINSKGGAMVLPESKLKLAVKHIQFERDSMFEGTSEVQNRENLNAKANITIVGLKYGLSNETSLGLIIPYKNLQATAKLGTNDVAIDNKGLGDIIVAARHIIVPMNKYGVQIAFDAGIKLPTGATNGSFRKAPAFANGINTPMPTQMGTGEFEYKVGIGVSSIVNDTWRVDSNLMYTYRPKANNEYDFGDELNLVVGTTKAITDKINIGVDYSFTYNSDTNMGSDTNPALRAMLPFKAFSGTAGYITPQIEFVPFGKPKLHFGAGVSLLTNYDLSQYQPLEKKRYIVTMGYLF